VMFMFEERGMWRAVQAAFTIGVWLVAIIFVSALLGGRLILVAENSDKIIQLNTRVSILESSLDTCKKSLIPNCVCDCSPSTWSYIWIFVAGVLAAVFAFIIGSYFKKKLEIWFLKKLAEQHPKHPKKSEMVVTHD